MAKKRKGKPGGHRLSGNPARRAAQLAVGRQGAGQHLLSRMVPGQSAPWWPASHDAIIGSAVTLAADSPLERENAAATIVGAEYWARMQTEEMGFFHDDWLAALAGRAADDLRAAVASGAEWQGLWHFLHGLAAMTPSISTSSGVPDLPTAVRRACATAHDAIAGAGLAPPGPVDTGPAQPAGDPVMLTDGYGSRFALIAPFAWGTEDRHWYSWDIDQCGTDNAVAAGVHDSLEAAVTEWRAAVGVAAASAEPTSCDLATAERLLTSAVPSGPFGAMLLEFESPEFTAEQFRLRQRALALLTRPPAVGDRSLPDVPVLVEDFMTWLGKRGGLVPDRQDASTLAYEWAMTPPPGYYACSPHRIKHAVILLTDSYETKYAEAALDVLPAWVEWCIERSRLSGELAGRSRAAAKRNRWDGRETERIRVLE